jgi:multidrug resistance efflux pump
MNIKLLLLLVVTLNSYGFDIYPQVSGNIVAILDEDIKFKKGDILVTIDDSRQQLEVQYLQQLLKNYQFNYDDKKLILKQKQELFDRMVGSQRDLSQAQLEFDNATRELEAFKIKIQIAQSHLRDYHIIAPFDGVVEKIVAPRNRVNITRPQVIMKINAL